MAGAQWSTVAGPVGAQYPRPSLVDDPFRFRTRFTVPPAAHLPPFRVWATAINNSRGPDVRRARAVGESVPSVMTTLRLIYHRRRRRNVLPCATGFAYARYGADRGFPFVFRVRTTRDETREAAGRVDRELTRRIESIREKRKISWVFKVQSCSVFFRLVYVTFEKKERDLTWLKIN